MGPQKPEPRRYNLTLLENLFNELCECAEKHGTSVAELVRKFIKLGLLAIDVKSAGGALLLRENPDGDLREILIL